MTRDQRERLRMDGIDARAAARRIASRRAQQRMADPVHVRAALRGLRAAVAVLDAPARDPQYDMQAYAELVDDCTGGRQHQLPLQANRHA